MPSSPADVVELAVVERGGFIESRHLGRAVVLSPDGSVVDALGDTAAPFLPRSSMKPLQALACLSAGAPLAGESLALAMASHAGTERHIAGVREILSAAGLGENDLGCPPSYPVDTASRDELVREHLEPSRICMTCSGKHAAMLLACSTNGWDPATYLDPAHPLQTHIREVIERLTGERIITTVVDGCGAPVHAMTLAGLARAVHRIGTSSERSPFALHRSAATLVRAVRENAWAIDGPGRPDTVVIERLGVFAKSGAEGIMVMVAPDGTTVALKVLDGSGRVGTAVALRLLERAGALPSNDVALTLRSLPLAVHGGTKVVGSIRAAF